MTYLETNKIYTGFSLKTIKTFPGKSVNCVITSPPYWQLRDYGFPEQWGLEPTFQEYLEHLWSLMDEIWRVLKDDGTVWVNLGDTYGTKSGNFCGGNIIENKIKYVGGIGNYTKPSNLHKSLLLIPHRFAIGCSDRGWIVRNDIIWAKRNGMPESVTDRFSKKHEYFFFMVKQPKYYFDLIGIKDKSANAGKSIRIGEKSFSKGQSAGMNVALSGNSLQDTYEVPSYKNPGSVSDFWDIPTQPSSAKHYATYNFDLIDKPIIAGCPENGIILDPFAGTGTTILRAMQLNRQAIGIEGNQEYAEIATKRINDFQQQTRLAI
jgi:DNA modification methylase